MDLVFCIDNTASMVCENASARQFIMSIVTRMLNSGIQFRACLIKFRSRDDSWNIRDHGFTTDIELFRQWVNSDEPGGMCPDGHKSVGDALHAALNVQWCSNIKLVYLITDGVPNGFFKELTGKDPWMMSTSFKERDIILYVIGGVCTIACDDFYVALAHKTEGKFIPLNNAEAIFSRVIPLVIDDGGTFPQAFKNISDKDIERNSRFEHPALDRTNDMINECATMDDMFGERFYIHKRS